MQIFLQESDFISFGYILRSVYIYHSNNHMVITFLGTSIVFYIVAIPLYIATNGIQVFSFFHILVRTYLLSFILTDVR